MSIKKKLKEEENIPGAGVSSPVCRCVDGVDVGDSGRRCRRGGVGLVVGRVMVVEVEVNVV